MAKRSADLVRIDGLEQLTELLEGALPKQANSVARSALRAVATAVKKEVKNGAPKVSGTLKEAIKVQTTRLKSGLVAIDVRVTHGNSAKFDAFYWRFPEYGTVNIPAQPFVQPAVTKMRPRFPQMFQELFDKKVQAFWKREQKKLEAKNATKS